MSSSYRDFPVELLAQTIYGHSYHDLIKLCSRTMNLQIAQENEALAVACKSGNLWINKVRFDLVSENTTAQDYFRKACLNGWTLLVNAMLQSNEFNFDPDEQQGICLVYAAMKNYIKIVQLLLNDHRCQPNTQRSDRIPIVNVNQNIRSYQRLTNSMAHDLAVNLGNFEVAEIILQDERVIFTDGAIKIMLNEDNLTVSENVEEYLSIHSDELEPLIGEYLEDKERFILRRVKYNARYATESKRFMRRRR